MTPEETPLSALPLKPTGSIAKSTCTGMFSFPPTLGEGSNPEKFPRERAVRYWAIDLGSERSWSGAWALWANGRSECYALAPGVPDLDEREKQDGMPRGLYRRLHEDGVLLVDEGLRVSRPEVLINHLLTIGINPQKVLCDRFLLGALQDATDGRWPIVPPRY